jgi:hypothetical protein
MARRSSLRFVQPRLHAWHRPYPLFRLLLCNLNCCVPTEAILASSCLVWCNSLLPNGFALALSNRASVYR